MNAPIASAVKTANRKAFFVGVSLPPQVAGYSDAEVKSAAQKIHARQVKIANLWASAAEAILGRPSLTFPREN